MLIKANNMVSNIVKLMKSNYEAIGFIPDSRIKEMDDRGCILHQIQDGEWVGYLVHGPLYPQRIAYIWQECIDKDVRNLGSGRDLVDKLIKKALKVGITGLSLRCAADLESNYFWRSMGFELIGLQDSTNKRKRVIYRYWLGFDMFSKAPNQLPRIIPLDRQTGRAD